MLEEFVIRPLVEVPHVIADLARQFEVQWRPYYGPDGPGDAEADLNEADDRDRIPLYLVVLNQSGAAIGSVALRHESILSHPHLTPWLAALYVAPGFRRRGIGDRLVAALEMEARRLGHKRIYVGTESYAERMERRGWKRVDVGDTLTGEVGIYALDL